MSAIKLEPGTTAAPAQETIEGKEPTNLIDRDLTDYLEEPEPPYKGVEHASEEEPPSAIPLPPWIRPTAGGTPTALHSNECNSSNQDFVRKYYSLQSGATSY